MLLLIVTTEIGLDGGGRALSCSRLINLLSKEHTVWVDNATDYPIATVDVRSYSQVEDAILKEYKLKNDCAEYQNVDAVIAFGAGYNGYYASLLAERLHKPFVLSLRGSDINLSKWFADRVTYLKEACRRANKIVCLSNEMLENIVSINPSFRDKISIIPNETKTSFIPVKFPNLPANVKVGCAASQLNEKKGILNLLHMVAEFKKISVTPIIFETVGQVDNHLMQSYTEAIRRLDLENNVRFIGYTRREELEKIMHGWDFYIQGSVCEGHPNSITECLRSGRAFISSKTGFLAELLGADFPPLFFDSWKPAVMAENLKRLIELDNKENIYVEAMQKINAACEPKIIKKKWRQLLANYLLPAKNISAAKQIEHVTTLALHDVQPDLRDSITMPESAFKDFVEFVFKSGYVLCSMKDYLQKTPTARRNAIICTFDDGYESLANIAMPILSRYSFTATVFVCTSLFGKDNTWNNKDPKLRRHMTTAQLRQLQDNGWEIASHGVTHRNLSKLNLADVEYELSQSKEILENLFGEVLSYAYPYGDYNKSILRLVGKYYHYAFAVMQGGTSLCADNWQIKRYSTNEIYKMLAD